MWGLHGTGTVDGFTRGESTLGAGKTQVNNSPQKYSKSLQTVGTVPCCAQRANTMIQRWGIVRNLPKKLLIMESETGVRWWKPGTGVKWLRPGNAAPFRGRTS